MRVAAPCRTIAAVGRYTRPTVACVGWLTLVGVIGWLDYLTGPDYGFGFFYLIAVVPAAWSSGRTIGIVVAVAAGFAWFAADFAVRPGAPVGAVTWNALSRGFLFVAAAVVIDRIRLDQSRLLEINAQRERFLRVLEHELPRPVGTLASAIDRLVLAGKAARDDLLGLKREAEGLEFLTRDFISLGQLQSGKLALERSPVDLRPFIMELVQLRPDRTRMLVSIPERRLAVSADVARLGQAVSAVLNEAVNVSEGDIRLDAGQTSGEIQLAISVEMPRGRETLRASAIDDSRLVGFELAKLILEAHGGRLAVFRRPVSNAFRAVLTLPEVADVS